MFKKYYSEFLAANNYIHMAAHSHHYWPDITKQATLDYWRDSRDLVDAKWEKIMGEVVPKSQELISKILNLKNPKQIAFASNTHELFARLLSCFPQSDLKILTTDCEFHSASRQLKRYNEEPGVSVNFIPAQSEEFQENFLKEVSEGAYDLICLSQVFFNSGKSLDMGFIEKIIENKASNTVLVFDGYHGFCAVPTDLSNVENDLFYMAGAYKYAQGGEGMCFMTIPEGCNLRPLNTGWFASFETLERKTDNVEYADDAQRFAGSTRDFCAHYRFNAVWEQFLKDKVTVDILHAHIQELQSFFLEGLDYNFTNTDLNTQGHFLTIECESESHAKKLYEGLKSSGVLTDYRANKLRFGFGAYLDKQDVQFVKKTLKLKLK